jgi:hypothetical protein
MASLWTAVERGLGQVGLLDDNEDFASLRASPDWEALRVATRERPSKERVARPAGAPPMARADGMRGGE